MTTSTPSPPSSSAPTPQPSPTPPASFRTPASTWSTSTSAAPPNASSPATEAAACSATCPSSPPSSNLCAQRLQFRSPSSSASAGTITTSSASPSRKLAEDSGLNAVSLHARTREQGYAGQARWHHIAEVKAAVRIPVIGNGDVRTPEDACALIAKTHCDAVMIGRAAPANPWIFRQIAQYTATGRYDTPTEDDRYRMIRTYFEMLLAEALPEAPGKMKQFASWFTHGVRGGAALRKSIYESKSGAAILEAVDRFFSREAADISETEPVEVCDLMPSFVEN